MLSLHGQQLIGAATSREGTSFFESRDRLTGAVLPGCFYEATPGEIDAACRKAAEAADALLDVTDEARARFLDQLADDLASSGPGLVERAQAETGLGLVRLNGERERTIDQLRMFARWVRTNLDGHHIVDQPKADVSLRTFQAPMGPIAVFAASNFPLAFSVLGGDTASAFAAGCPVVLRAHAAHPGTSEIVAEMIRRTIRSTGMPEGMFSMLQGTDHAIGKAIVSHDDIAAVAFTGSRKGGLALTEIAALRRRPIPVFAEMSSVNPVVLLPGALRERGEQIAAELISSLVLGAGQFCTSPGLVIAMDSPDTDRFIEEVAVLVANVSAMPMLTTGIEENYVASCSRLSTEDGVQQVAGQAIDALAPGAPIIFATTDCALLRNPDLQQEIFGPATLIVRCSDQQSMLDVIQSLEGQLTGAIHFALQEECAVDRIVRALAKRVGRVISNGFGTGVAVSPAMVHGGPFPATSDARYTSVGTMAADRFMRPICYQNFPIKHLETLFRHRAASSGM